MRHTPVGAARQVRVERKVRAARQVRRGSGNEGETHTSGIDRVGGDTWAKGQGRWDAPGQWY